MKDHNFTASKPLPQQAAECIRQYIRKNNMEVGDKLPNEFQLAELCQVGRSTIREAVKILIFQGQVEVVRGSGTFIARDKQQAENDPMGFQNDKDMVKRALEFFDVRLMLEPEVAAMAAANATYKDCQKLREMQREVERCVGEGADHLQADILFHTQIAECSKNKVVYNLMEIIVKGIPVFVEATRNILANDTINHHRAIADAIEAGDGVGAKCAMITHLNHNRERILKNMSKNT